MDFSIKMYFSAAVLYFIKIIGKIFQIDGNCVLKLNYFNYTFNYGTGVFFFKEYIVYYIRNIFLILMLKYLNI